MLREVLDGDDIVSAVTSSRDVDTAKPKPEIVHVALGRAERHRRPVFIGDAVWDGEAARRAGVTCIGVLSGGVSRSELHSAGADRGAEVKPLTDAGISQP